MFETLGARQFFEAWSHLRQGNEIPHYRTLFDQLPAKLVPNMFVVEETPEGQYMIRFMGTERVEQWGADLTRTDSMQTLSTSSSKAALQNLKTILDHPCGIRAIVTAVSVTGREMNVEYLALPASVDPGKPRRIISHNTNIGGANYTQGTGKVSKIMPRSWIDLGYGVPKTPPSA